MTQQIGRWIQSSGRFFVRRPRPGLAGGDDKLGLAGEKLAAKYLKRQGYRILARSHRQPLGEIDLIALDAGSIVFIEVKTRTSTDSGQPFEAVDRRKQEKLTRAALTYLKKHGLLEKPSRFDVISILAPPGERPQIRHIQDAFEAVGSGQMFR